MSYFFIGLSDDYLSIKNKKNTGLKSNQKFFLQTLISILFIFIALEKNYISPEIVLTNNLEINFFGIKSAACFLAIVGLLSTVVAAFYYLRIIKIIYFDPEKEMYEKNHHIGLKLTLLLSLR